MICCMNCKKKVNLMRYYFNEYATIHLMSEGYENIGLKFCQ
jgi:hypothetical protein